MLEVKKLGVILEPTLFLLKRRELLILPFFKKVKQFVYFTGLLMKSINHASAMPGLRDL